MRFQAIAVVAALAALQSVALAETAEEMRSRGEQLAKDGRFTEAIDAFKAAERIEPRARHSCLIALAYIRREAWPQAEIFLEQCEKRATPADPVPEWVPAAKQQLADRLAQAKVSAVDIKVEPAGVTPKLAVSSFALDELFDPRTIHLPPGRHTIIATAQGYNDAQKTITVNGTEPQTVTITMLPVGTVESRPPPDAVKVQPQAASASKLPYVIMGAGAGVAIIGGIVHVTKMRSTRDDIDSATTIHDYNSKVDTFHKWRNVTIGMYAVGGAAIVTGLVLKATVFNGKEAPVQVAVNPMDGGGMVTVGWSTK
ncbi:hypothetical protein BH11MYX2_BH11MYX2_13640 [soil metagenome]